MKQTKMYVCTLKNDLDALLYTCHFLSIFQKLFLQFKNIYNLFYLDDVC